MAAVAIAFAVPLVVLLASLRTEVGFWDTADLQTVAWIAGIPYPTGFPGYVLVGWLWTHVIPLGSPAVRLNALSAVAVAGGAACVCALALLFEVVPLLAVLTSWLFAFAHPVWQRAAYADVHPLGFAVAFAALALTVRWALRGEPRALGAAIVTAGVAVAIDNTTVLMLAGALVAACSRRPPLRPLAAALAAAAVIVLCAYAYLPLRSAYVVAHGVDPTLTLGIPPGRPYWDDHDPRTPDGFRALVSGSDWGPHDTLARLFTPEAIQATVARFGGDVREDVPGGLLLVALAGLAFAAVRAPLVAAGLVLAAAVPALFGGSYTVEADPYRYVFALYAVIALGVALAAGRAVRAAGRTGALPAAGAVAALLALVLVRDVARAADVRSDGGDPRPQSLIDRVAAKTREGAVVVGAWNFASTLAYGAYVEGALGTRVVLCADPGEHADRYADWLRTREIVAVAADPPVIPGYHTRLLSAGYPNVYEVVP